MEQKYEEVEIFDTTCRDGEQATDGFREGIESKLLIAKKLSGLGVSTIEAGFPRSSEGDFEAVQRIAREIQGPYICALARCVKDDIDKAWKAIKDNEKPTLHIFTFMVDSESLSAYGKEDFEDIIKQSTEAAGYAKELMKGKGRVEFSAQNATIGDRNQIFELYSKTIKAGADVVNLPDTSGYSFPFEIFGFVSAFRKNVEGSDKVIVSTHCHNDLGNATANSIAAIQGGVRQVECTINGIGERAGNAALEEVVMNMRTRRKTLGADTKIKTEMLGEISWMIRDHSEFTVQPNKAIVGSNAFRHSSGIHQDGVRKGAKYEIMDPESVGWIGESFEITARSGKGGYIPRLERLGYQREIIEPVIADIVKSGKKLCDEKRKLDDIDLRWITDEKISPVEKRIVYKSKKLRTENGYYVAEVTVEIDGEEVTKTAEHNNGAVDALFSATDAAIGVKVPRLVIYEPKNVGKGHEATAKVTIALSDNGFRNKYDLDEPVYIGRAVDKDTLDASLMAYVHAINRYFTEKKQ
jgi:2-isopropylmalate synthase